MVSYTKIIQQIKQPLLKGSCHKNVMKEIFSIFYYSFIMKRKQRGENGGGAVGRTCYLLIR